MNINEFISACESLNLKSELDPNYKPKGKLYLSDFKMERVAHITKEMKNSPLSFFKLIDEKSEITYLWRDKNNEIVGVGSVKPVEANGKKYNWITSVQLNPKYRGYGLGTQILDFCVKKLKGNALTVATNNEVALNIYKKYGFKISKESLADAQAGRRKEYYMYL